jgi:DNA-binding transcriptional LysR family regulator
VAPYFSSGDPTGESPISGKNISVVALTWLPRFTWLTWIVLPFWLARNGFKLAREHPRLQIQLRTLRTQELEEAVLRGEVEFAVGLSPAQSPELVSEPYRPEKLVFFARPDDPLTRMRKLKRRDLASIPLVVRGRKNEPGATEEALKQIEAHGAPLNIAMRCDTAVSVKTCVRDRLGVGLLHLDHVKNEIERGDFKLVKISGIELEGQSYIVYHRERPLTSLSAEFLSLLRKARSEIL